MFNTKSGNIVFYISLWQTSKCLIPLVLTPRDCGVLCFQPRFNSTVLRSALLWTQSVNWSSHWKWNILSPSSILNEWQRWGAGKGWLRKKNDLEILEILSDLRNDLSFHYRMMFESNLNIEGKKGKEGNITSKFIDLIKWVIIKAMRVFFLDFSADSWLTNWEWNSPW